MPMGGGAFVRKAGDTMTGTLDLDGTTMLVGGTNDRRIAIVSADIVALGSAAARTDIGSNGTIEITGTPHPSIDNAYDIGSDTNNWKIIYLKGNVDFQTTGTIKDPINAAATALSGTQRDIQINIGGVPYYFTVYPTKA